jgi:hypothetical protein
VESLRLLRGLATARFACEASSLPIGRAGFGGSWTGGRPECLMIIEGGYRFEVCRLQTH